VIGFICNFLVKAVDRRFHMKETDERAAGASVATAKAATAEA
jgi:hypothetical protein